MHCYYHDGVEAVAICRACNRGLCHGCALEAHGAMACKGTCAEKNEAPQNRIENGRITTRFWASGSRNIFSKFLIALGSAMVIGGFTLIFMMKPSGGALFILLGNLHLILADLYHRGELVREATFGPDWGEK